ncbi:MAG TPA: hypothetical protein VH476_01555 [Solirubrobacterales bacterium]|jgi:hypothetical protein
MSSNGEVLWMLAVHLALTGAPGVAATLAAMRLGVRDVPLLLAIGLAASGLAAFIAFWAYFAEPTIGQAWNYVLVLGSVQVGFLAAYRGNLDRELLRQLRIPLLLWVLGSVFVVYLGFLHGGTDNPLGMSSSRYEGGLPSDNDIPRYFAEWFAAKGHHGTPPLFPPDWLMSDRPPLQVGYVLSQESITVADTQSLHYEILASVIQQLWIVGLWAVLAAARVRRVTIGLAMLAALVSDIAIIYGFFVWPKLIAGAFLLAALALVISPSWDRWKRDWRVGALLGALLALGMLAHGASIYGVLPVLIVAAYRGLPSWRWIGAAALVGIVMMGSWSAYQRYDDPPGNRLIKWHLAGVEAIDSRGSLETIVDSYREAGLGGAIEDKWNNVKDITGIERDSEIKTIYDNLKHGDVEEAINWIRGYRFFELLPMLGLLLIGPLAMAIRRRHRESEPDWRFALIGFAYVGIGCFFWALLQWGTPGESSAIIHAGTTAIPLIAIAACVVAMASVSTGLAIAVVAINALFVLFLYVPAFTPLPGTSYSPIAAILAALGLLGYAYVAIGGIRRPRPTAPT